MDLNLRILGSSSAIPISNRNPTSQFLTIANRHFLLDCGEGTQIQLRKNKIGFGRVNHILISHLHGDHFYGLVPLLTSLHLLDRSKKMHIYGPPALEKGISDILKLSKSSLRFELEFHPLRFDKRDLIYEDEAITIHSFPLDHSLPCCGFLFQEKERPRNFRKDILEKHSIPVPDIKKIKRGADWEDENGNIIKNEDLTTEPSKPLSYAFCTDTAPVENLAELLDAEPSLLYHEATFSEQHRERAAHTKHSTAKQAASMAAKVKAKHLLLGHFSVRYEELDHLVEEAKEEFENSYLAKEDFNFTLKSENELIATGPRQRKKETS